ncbi:MAG TPA: single-stranded DNA-binding protein [Saprospiraceae bacterium]|nr:single-stranded DNA-binding protein [Saprospiraceae bacterium]
MINKVILIGNLGKDPEVRTLESGAKVVRFPLATNESYQDKSGEWQTVTEWHNVTMWRNLAERAEKDLKKGSLIYLDGKLSTRKWTDKEGQDRYTTEVVANTFRKLDRRDQLSKGEDDSFNASNDSITHDDSTQDDLPF